MLTLTANTTQAHVDALREDVMRAAYGNDAFDAPARREHAYQQERIMMRWAVAPSSVRAEIIARLGGVSNGDDIIFPTRAATLQAIREDAAESATLQAIREDAAESAKHVKPPRKNVRAEQLIESYTKRFPNHVWGCAENADAHDARSEDDGIFIKGLSALGERLRAERLAQLELMSGQCFYTVHNQTIADALAIAKRNKTYLPDERLLAFAVNADGSTEVSQRRESDQRWEREQQRR